jgi:hypothetical protein
VTKQVVPQTLDDSDNGSDEEDKSSASDDKNSKKKTVASKLKPVKPEQAVDKVKAMDFLYKKTVNKPNEEYLTMTGKPSETIEAEIKTLKERLLHGENKAKKWSNDLGNRIIGEVLNS